MAFDFTDPRHVARRAGLYALAFEEAGQVLAVQERVLAEMRGRAAGLLAAAGVTASIFGGPLGGSGRGGPALYVAMAAFAGVALCTLALLWPNHLDVAADPQLIVSEYAEPIAVPLPLVHRDLAMHRAVSVERNGRKLATATTMLQAALSLFATEVLAWLANLVLDA